jgi:hypothetical protein
MSENRITSLAVSTEGPRQTPNQSFGLTLAKALASGSSGALGLASPLLGAINPALSAPVTKGAQIIGSFAASAGPAAMGKSAPGHEDPLGAASGGGSGGDSWDLMKAQQAMQDQSRDFNMQYLQLQESMQRESREYQTLSNVMKVRHDSAKAAINNIH